MLPAMRNVTSDGKIDLLIKYINYNMLTLIFPR